MNKLHNELKLIFKLTFVNYIIFGNISILIQFILIRNNIFSKSYYEIFNFIGFLTFFFSIYIFTKFIKILKKIEKEKRIIITGLLFLTAYSPSLLLIRKSTNFLLGGGN